MKLPKWLKIGRAKPQPIPASQLPNLPRPGDRVLQLGDGLANELAGIGGQVDRTLNTRWQPSQARRSQHQIEDAIANSGILERFVTRPVEDMLRAGIEYPALSPDQVDTLTDYLDELDFWFFVKQALITERQAGGAAIWIDNGDVARDLPLQPGGLRKIRRLVLFDPDTLSADKYAMHSEPEHWLVHGADPSIPAGRIHKSRLLIFPGRIISAARRWANQGWGDPEISKVWNAWEALTIVRYILPNIAITYEQGVFKFKGLTEQLETEFGKRQVLTKALDLQMASSYLNAHLIDAEDSFDRHGVPLAGLAEMMGQAERQYVQDSGLPHTLALGESPGASLGEGGKSQKEDYYTLIAGMQRDRLYRQLRQFFRMIAKIIKVDAKKLKFTFCPLGSLTELEQADLENKRATRDKTYVDAGVMGEEEIREDLQKRETYRIKSIKLPEEAEDLGEGLEDDDQADELEPDDQAADDEAPEA